MTIAVAQAPLAQRFAELTAATEKLIDAEGAYIVALSVDEPIPTEYANLATALVDHARATLAVKLAHGGVAAGAMRIVTIEHREGDEWRPLMGGGMFDAQAGEAASAQAERHAVEEGLVGSDLTWRVLVWTDPSPGAEPDGEWTNLAIEPASA